MVSESGAKLDNRLTNYFGGGYKDGNNTGWVPIPELNQTDSDITVFFLGANGITYDTNVTDPWFSANTPYTIGKRTTITSDVFINRQSPS